MDSVTDQDIDRIFRRIEKQVNLRSVGSAQELFNIVENQPGTRTWNDALNNLVWERVEERVNTDVTLYRYKALAEKQTQNLGFIGAIRDAADKIIGYVKRVSMIYRKDGRTQLVARDNKGRFTKISKTELREVFK